MDTKQLIKAKKNLEYNIYIMLKDFEEETALKVYSVDLERTTFSFPDDSILSNVLLEVLLP